MGGDENGGQYGDADKDFDGNVHHSVFRNDWWVKKASDLETLARNEGTPLYVYDRHTVQNCARTVKNITGVDRAHFAIKANPNVDILKALDHEGIGFECVSIGELNHILAVFPNIDKKRILFTPNFAPRKEYEYAISLGIQLTVDSLYPLERWGEIFNHLDIMVRLDPGHGKGHHKYVKTAGKQSKFGISLDNIPKLVSLVEQTKCRVVALHCHVGSGILSNDTWSETASFLSSLLPHFPSLKALDLGGGFGIVERHDQTPLDFSAISASLKEVKAKFPQLELWVEPGRYLVANSGVLLCANTQTKEKGDLHYVGVDTGFNSLVRPVMYGAYHFITNCSALAEQNRNAPYESILKERPIVTAHIVGPICETGDVLGHSRKIHNPAEGDIILIANTGAYGYSMSSFYNMRSPAKEIMI